MTSENEYVNLYLEHAIDDPNLLGETEISIIIGETRNKTKEEYIDADGKDLC